MLNINFNLRDKNSDKETPINVVIRWNNQKLVYPSGDSIHPKYWDPTTQKALSTKKYREHPEFNLRLIDMETKISRCFRSFEIDNGRLPAIDEFRNELNLLFERTIKEAKVTLTIFIQKFREEAKTKTNVHTGVKLADKTLTSYNQLQTVLNEYNAKRRKPVDFEDIDLEFYRNFTKFLTDTKNFSVNNIGKHIKTLKTIMNDATERGYNKNLTFKSKKFLVQKQSVDSIYLDYLELKLIEELDLSKEPKYDRVRDLFLVGCYTGLRFSDFTSINHKNIKNDILEIETQKTGETVAIPIHDVVKNILVKYEGKFQTPLPPALSNQKMNEYLKEICKRIDALKKKVSIKETKGGETSSDNFYKYELVTTHTARRSFATNNFKSGIPAQLIMKITGHGSEKVFLNYIKITSTESAELMRNYWNNL